MGEEFGSLVEREIELEALGRVLASARAGTGGALLVEGPPGIGKSSLLAAARADADGLRVLSARGGELEREFAFGIVRQLLEPLLVAAGADERSALLAGAAALAEPVLLGADGEAGAQPPFSALHGLHWLTVNLAGAQPLLAIVDDVHWADLASLRWLVHLARRLEGVPVALLLAARPAEAGAGQALLDELPALGGVAVVRPGDLSEQAVAALAGRRFGAEPDPEFVAACHRSTGGNPFLLRELFGELERRSLAPSRESAGEASRLSSLGAGRAVRGRLRRLEPECRALAHAVAVLGGPAEPAVAARVAGLDDVGAARAAGALAGVAILEPGRPLAFIHPLVRSTVYAELSATERAAAHARAASVLDGFGAARDRIALHLLLAPARADPRTVDTLRRAAAGASARGAPEVAVTYLRRALEEPPERELRPAVAYELGSAALRAGDLEAAIERLREAVRELPSEGARARAADALGSALFQAHRAEEAMAVLTAAIDSLSPGAREQGLRLQATRWIGGIGSVAAWRELRAARERFAVRGATADTTGERLQLAMAAYDAARTATAAEARELALRALAHGRLLEDPGPESSGYWGPVIMLLLAHALEDVTRACDAALDWARRHGSLPAFSIATQLRAYVWWRRGSLADAEADAASALEHAVVPGFPPWGREALANVLLARGEPDAAEAARPRAPTDLGGVRSLWHLDTRARVRAASQRVDEAVEDLFLCGRLEREWEIRTPAFCGWRADAALLLSAAGRAVEAERLAREELERCRAFGAPGPLGAALRALGRLSERAAQLALLEESAGVLAGSPARLEHALALVELGAALRRAGRRTDARERLREGLELARGCGAEAVAARAHGELVAAGARPRRDPTESRSRLTAGELRVARLAAEGLDNREIAQSLFLTENTIQTRLKSVFGKLEIGSRSQLARAL